MVTASFRVEHGHCALCGAGDVPLFMLDLAAGREARVVPLPDRTHTGICRACIEDTARNMLAGAEGVGGRKTS